MKNVLFFCALAFLAVQCKQAEPNKGTGTATDANPLLQKWGGAYNGFPPFDKVQVAQFKPAFEVGMDENRAEINKIVADSEPPTFQNTIEALEKTGNTLKRVRAIYEVWKSNMATSELDAAQETIEPRLAAFSDSITQNTLLFKKIEAVNAADKSKLTGEQKRLVEKYYTNFVLAGAKLDDKSKARVAAINQQLASSFAKFSQHLLSDEGDKFLELTNIKEIDGLTEGVKNAEIGRAHV